LEQRIQGKVKGVPMHAMKTHLAYSNRKNEYHVFWGLIRVNFHKISTKKYFFLSNGLKIILKFTE